MQRCCRLVLPEAICILYLLYFPEVEVVFAGFYGGGIKCRRVVSSRYEWTRLVLGNCRVDFARLSIKAVFVVVVVGV